MKYLNLFIDLQKKEQKGFLDKYLKNFYSTTNGTKYFDINNVSIEELIKSKLEKINILSIHLFSIFGYINFELEQISPWYTFPSYGGVLGGIFMILAGFKARNMIGFTLAGGVTCACSILLSLYLKKIYIKNSKDNFIMNAEKMIQFLAMKKDKIIGFTEVLEKFFSIYSKECLELLDLVTNIK